MAVYKLCRVALGLGGDGLDTHFINLLVGRRGEYSTEAEFLKENGPEGIIFVHIENSWDSDFSASCFFRRKRLIAEDSLYLILKEVWNFRLCFRKSCTALTAISGNELSSVTEIVNGEHAFIAAKPAATHGVLIL